MTYSSLTFPGSMLQPGFSIYLFKISAQGNEYFYVGMTGDHYYPSARSAIHRLSGHLELLSNSTQNQLNKAFIDKKIGKIDNINMHHWAIDGFTKWEGKLKGFKKMSLSKNETDLYEKYLKAREKVHELEKYLIFYTKEQFGEKCLNKAVKEIRNFEKDFDNIVQYFKAIVNE